MGPVDQIQVLILALQTLQLQGRLHSTMAGFYVHFSTAPPPISVPYPLFLSLTQLPVLLFVIAVID